MKHTRLLALTLFVALLLPITGFAQDQFFDSNGLPMRYIESGSGPVIVLLHGNARSSRNWVDFGIFADLARDYRVVALDARGHGKSGKPHDVNAYGREMGLDVIRLLDHLGVNQAHVVGYSMGAQTAAWLLTSYPDRFITATLGGAPGWFTWTDADNIRVEKEAAEKERDCVSRSQLLRLAPPNEPPMSDAEFRTQSEVCMADPDQDRFALAALHRAYGQMAITPTQAAAVKVPTLGIVGSLDPYVSDFQQLKQLRPDLKLVVLEGAIHAGERGAMRRPEFVTAVREFIASNSGR